MIRVGQVGIGQWGKNHSDALCEIDEIKTVGVYDINPKQSKRVVISPYYSLSALIRDVDALIITTPTSTHYEIAKLALENGVHVFIEKPVCSEVWQAEELAKLANGSIIQVGHIERFNPAYQRLKKEKFNPRHIMCHRYTETPDRCNDVSVVLDLMIHDIDLVLDLMCCKIKSIHAINDGRIVLATLKFDDNKEVILYSGISKFKSRKMMIWTQHGNDYKLDFQERSLHKNGKPIQETTDDNLFPLQL